MKNLFILAHTGWEDWNPYYLEGPENTTQDEFEKLCNSLVEEAGHISVADDNFKEDFIGWNEIMESMMPLLEKQGYHRFNPKQCVFAGRNIIDNVSDATRLESAISSIIEHNQGIRDSF